MSVASEREMLRVTDVTLSLLIHLEILDPVETFVTDHFIIPRLTVAVRANPASQH